jgi:hypothetical protein
MGFNSPERLGGAIVASGAGLQEAVQPTTITSVLVFALLLEITDESLIATYGVLPESLPPTPGRPAAVAGGLH